MKSTHMNKWKQKVKIYIYSYTCVYILCAVFLQQTKSRGNRKKINERNACFVMRYTLRLLIESCNTNEWMHDIVSVRPLLHTFSFLQREERKWNTQSSASDSGNSLKKRRKNFLFRNMLPKNGTESYPFHAIQRNYCYCYSTISFCKHRLCKTMAK